MDQRLGQRVIGGGSQADTLRIEVEDPQRSDVLAMQARHLAFAQSSVPPVAVHALRPEGLRDPALTVYGARAADGLLLGIGALRQPQQGEAEIKSMHTHVSARGRGVGRALLMHLISIGTARGYPRISLETGTGVEFLPARALYASAGFVVCEPFGDYPDSPHSVCMTLALA
ncbi:MAG: putative acetyltransferase [Actinomycetota bacterium]|nr:putative acetyltransferase [Actinomycetota bacterium]